jgi:tryptophanyl-tRNA synthetase
MTRTHSRPDRALSVCGAVGLDTGDPISKESPMSTSTLPSAPIAPSSTTTGRRLSGFKPTGQLHLGNYLGAIRPMVDAQGRTDSVVMIADLHALTVEHDPTRLRQLTNNVLATLLASGVDPKTTLCYLQSDVPEHAELHYLLECATGYGEAARMIQFKELQQRPGHVRLSLLTYPVLMAADILLHDVDEVPVGDGQTQHIELARDVANRFNTRYGARSSCPAVNPVAARVMTRDPPARWASRPHRRPVWCTLDEPTWYGAGRRG